MQQANDAGMLPRPSPGKLDTYQSERFAPRVASCASDGRVVRSDSIDRMVHERPQEAPMANAPDEILEEPVPVMQQFLDNPFLLLFVGIATPTVLYIIWGVMEIVSIPISK
jgi:hypothetical protein